MKKQTVNPFEKYLFDVNIVDELYITLDKTKMQHNGDNFRHYTVDAIDIENTKYCIAVYNIGTNTVLTILEHGEILNSQFLITSEDIRDYIKIEDLTQYVSREVADLVLG